MNLFNCFQAVGFYTITPFGIQWLFKNGHDTWGYVLSISEFVGFILIANAINDSKFMK